MKTQTKVPSLIQAILPLIVLIALLSFNVSYFDDPLGGSNQIALIIAASICSILPLFNHVSWHEIQRKILQTINSAMTAILILLLIGSLSGSWMLSGVSAVRKIRQKNSLENIVNNRFEVKHEDRLCHGQISGYPESVRGP